MALQKQKIPLALNTPIDTKSDEYLTPGFSTLENVRHKKTGGLVKRNGYTKLTQEIANTSGTTPFTETISNALALKSYKDELLLLSEDGVFSYSSHNATGTNSWLTRDYVNKQGSSGGSVVRKDSGALSATVFESVAISTPQIYEDAHYLETTDYKIISADNNDTMTVSVMDINTGALIVQRQFPLAKSNIATDNTYLYVMGRQQVTQDFAYYPIPLTNLNQAVSALSISGLDFSTNNITSYDVVSDTNQVFLVASRQSALQYSAAAYTLVGATATNTSTTSMGSDFTSLGPLEMRVVNFQGGYRASYCNKSSGGTLIRFITFNSAGAVTSGPTSIGSAGNYHAVCSDSNNTYIIYVNSTTFMATINAAGTTTISTFINTTWFPQSQPVIYNDNIYITIRSGGYTNVGHSIVIRKNLNKSTSASLFAKSQDFVFNPIVIDGSGINTAVTGFPRMFLNGSTISTAGRAITDVVAPDNITSQNGGFNCTVSSISYVFDSAYKSVSIAAGMIVSGSLTKLYDGSSYTELGFLETPIITSFTAGTPNPTGEFTNGTYGMATVHTWVDAAGNVHRSAPEFKSITVSGGPVTSLDYSFYTLILTEKENFKTEVYLTEVNGTTYYKTNEPGTSPNSFIFTADPTREILYTQSGELENDPPLASIGVTYFKNRLFSVSRNQLQYSKPIEAARPVEFNSLQTISLDAEGGDATGIYGMDNNLIIFKKNSIYQLSGEGPNALGQQNDYGTPQLITTDTGNIDLNSIVAYPNGLLFKSKKGIYEINRGLYAQYIGAAVADFNQFDVVSSQLLPEVNEIRFVLSNGNILIFDYQERQWAVDTITNAISGVSHNNVFYYVNSDSEVLGENALYFDNYEVGQPLQPYSAKVATNWIQVAASNAGASLSAGVQQWQRLYAIHVLGRYKSTHTLKVSLAYNFDDTIVDFATISPSGSGLYQYVIKPSLQKCEAVKIIIEDTNTSLTNGESMELSSVLLEIGLKGTAQKQTGDSSSSAAT